MQEEKIKYLENRIEALTKALREKECEIIILKNKLK